jgi:hypothetical protein
MTSTILVPAWGEHDDLKPRESGLEAYVGSRRSMGIQFSHVHGCDVFLIQARLTVLPERLADLPMRRVQLVKHNSPITKATDGRYVDDAITALVETYVSKDGIRRQSITVTAPTLDTVNDWFDALLRGEKSDLNVAPITYPEN